MKLLQPKFALATLLLLLLLVMFGILMTGFLLLPDGMLPVLLKQDQGPAMGSWVKKLLLLNGGIVAGLIFQSWLAWCFRKC